MADRKGKQWVLLAAGSYGWENYRHQANVCHAYQVIRKNGIPDEQIVVMMYDDIAHNNQNPTPGTIINEPNGPNVYPGVPKDFTGTYVSADYFLAALRGDKIGHWCKRKKVIRSGKNDSIFVYLSDHGGDGIFHFPHSTLYACDLIQTLNTMVKNRKFSKMVIYMESCHSGSMLYQLSERNVYGVTSCRPDENSYACFYDETKHNYLADLFSSAWLNHTERVNTCSTSFGQQFIYVKEQVTKAAKEKRLSQTPCNYGDMGILTVMLSDFLGVSFASVIKSYTPQPLDFLLSDVVDTTEVPLIIQKNRIKNEQDPEKRQALQRQYDDLKRKRKIVDEVLQKIAERTNTSRALTEKREVTRMYTLKLVAEHFRKNIFNWEEEQFVVTRQHLQVLVNLCECVLEVESIIAAIDQVKQEITF